MKPNKKIVLTIAGAMAADGAGLLHAHQGEQDEYVTVQRATPVTFPGQHVPHEEANPQVSREVIEFVASGVSSSYYPSWQSQFQFPNARRAHLIASGGVLTLWDDRNDA
jgi:hypothetical protein